MTWSCKIHFLEIFGAQTRVSEEELFKACANVRLAIPRVVRTRHLSIRIVFSPKFQFDVCVFSMSQRLPEECLDETFEAKAQPRTLMNHLKPKWSNLCKAMKYRGWKGHFLEMRACLNNTPTSIAKNSLCYPSP